MSILKLMMLMLFRVNFTSRLRLSVISIIKFQITMNPFGDFEDQYRD